MDASLGVPRIHPTFNFSYLGSHHDASHGVSVV